jgi:hypothetical protein
LVINRHGEQYTLAGFERRKVPTDTQTPNGRSLRQPAYAVSWLEEGWGLARVPVFRLGKPSVEDPTGHP